MDRKPAAKPPETASRPPATPAVTRTQTADVRAAKARALAYKDNLPSNNARSTATRSISAEGPAARRRTAAAASSEAAAAQQRRAEGLAARGARPARAGPTRETELKVEAREGLSAEPPAPGARTPAPQSPSRGRALLEAIAACGASELPQLREAFSVRNGARADEAEAFAESFVDRKYEYTETPEASVNDLKLSLAAALEDRDAARAAQTPALQKITAKYAPVRDSLGVVLNRADHLATELLAEQLARRRDHAVALLRRFADLVLFHVRLRRVEVETARRFDDLPVSSAAVTAGFQNEASANEQRAADDDPYGDPGSGSDSDGSHQSRLQRVAQHTTRPMPRDALGDGERRASRPRDFSQHVRR